MAKSADATDAALKAGGLAREQLAQLVFGVTRQCAHLFRYASTVSVLTEQIANVTKSQPAESLVGFYANLEFEPNELGGLADRLARFREAAEAAPSGRVNFDELVAPVYGYQLGEMLPRPLLFNSRHAISTMFERWLDGQFESETERFVRLRAAAEFEARLLLSWRSLEISSLRNGRDLGYEIRA